MDINISVFQVSLKQLLKSGLAKTVLNLFVLHMAILIIVLVLTIEVYAQIMMPQISRDRSFLLILCHGFSSPCKQGIAWDSVFTDRAIWLAGLKPPQETANNVA